MNRPLPLLAISGAVLLLSCANNSGTAPGADYPAPQGHDYYLIGTADVLEILVWQHPEVSRTVPVRPDGRISTPLVRDMTALGKTPSQLAADIEVVLSESLLNPKVHVIVTDISGQSQQQVRVVGSVAEPTSLPYRRSMTLLDLMIEVGGLTEFAAGNRAKIIRTLDTGTIEIPVRLHDLLDKGRISEDIGIWPGDILMVPESGF